MYKHHIPFKAIAYSLVLIVSSLSWVACEKLEDLFTFRLNNEVSFMIPSAIGVNTPYSVPTPDVKTNARQTFENNGTNINKVKDIKLESLDLTITSPSNATFKPVKSINIYIVSEGLPKKLIAYKNDIPSTIGNKLILETTLENLDAYVKKESYSLETETVLREAIFQDFYLDAQMAFLVSVNF